MPPPDAPPLTRIVVLRALGFGVAIALGAVAVWLIVVADSTKSVQLGVLAGIWGALLGAFSMFGARRHGLEPEDAQLQARSEVPVLSAQEIAMRTPGEVERIAEAAARRAFEDRLEQMLRREISREVGDLRGEIARLRQDLLDKVGGQLRLERIETTRVIGSDLEALQHEVRQLKQASETGMLHELGIGVPPKRLVVEQAVVRPVSRAAADVQPARSATPEPAGPPAPADRPAASAPPKRPATEDTVRPVAAANGTAGHAASSNGAPGGSSKGAVSNGAPGKGASAPGGSSNGAASNGAASNGAASNGAASNGAASNGAASNGAASNGAASNGAARSQTPRAAAPAPAETTGPIRLQQPTDASRPARPAAEAPAAEPHTPTPKPAETWSPPAPPTPAAPPPAAPAPAAPPPSSDPFASLPRITPFTEFELDPVDTTAARTRPEPPDTRPSGPASPVAPANSAYTGRRRRTDGAPDAGRHSRHDAPAPPPAAPGGRRRRADEDTDDSDLLSRLLARGSADR